MLCERVNQSKGRQSFDDGDPCTVDSCDPSTGCVNLDVFINVLFATGQEYDGNSQIVEVLFGLHSGAGSAKPDPNNWSQDKTVRLQLIDEQADPNNIGANDLLVEDLRPAASSGQTEAWYVMVVIGDAADPNVSGYYPVLSWEPLGCTEIDDEACVYELRSRLSTSGTVLVDDMADTNSYQMDILDGDPAKYFTILMTCEPPKPPGRIFPWPGVYPGGLGWVGAIPFSAGFPGGLPYPMKSGYAPGLSIPSFPGTYPGFTYPGGIAPFTSYAWTSYVPRFPVTFPALGIFSPVGPYGWPINYWTGYPWSFTYQTGWFYTY